MKSLAQAALAAVCSLVLAACGGGGGGGGGGVGMGAGAGFSAMGDASLPVAAESLDHPATPEAAGSGAEFGAGSSETDPPSLSQTFTTVPVSITTASPASFESIDWERDIPHPYSNPTWLTLEAIGDFNVLVGKTVYVILEDPDSLFEAKPDVYPFYSDGRGGVMLALKPKLKKAGTYRGALKIYACLDLQCSVRLGAVPFKIPYNLLIKPNARFAANGTTAISETAVYSDSIQKVAMPVLPAEGKTMASWEMQALFTPSFGGIVNATLNANADGTGTLTVDVPAGTPPGTYELGFVFSTKQYEAYVPTRTLKVDLHVVPNQHLSHFFTPTAVEVVTKISSRDYWQTGPFQLHFSNGTMTYEGFEVLLTPAQQATLPSDLVFLAPTVSKAETNRLLMNMHVSACRYGLNGVSGLTCIPTGAYDFRAKFIHTVDGVSQPVYFNLRQTVVP